MVDVPVVPARTVTVSGLAETAKSGPITNTTRVAEWVRAGDGLVPFTLRS